MEEKHYYVKTPVNIELVYDKQNDTLYVYFNSEDTPEEEILSEDGDVALGFKEGKLIVIQITRFSEKIGGYIL
ncbi:MAG: DUF2283 domain-containing protein [Desulfurococcaceae archaeon]